MQSPSAGRVGDGTVTSRPRDRGTYLICGAQVARSHCAAREISCRTCADRTIEFTLSTTKSVIWAESAALAECRGYDYTVVTDDGTSRLPPVVGRTLAGTPEARIIIPAGSSIQVEDCKPSPQLTSSRDESGWQRVQQRLRPGAGDLAGAPLAERAVFASEALFGLKPKAWQISMITELVNPTSHCITVAPVGSGKSLPYMVR